MRPLVETESSFDSAIEMFKLIAQAQAQADGYSIFDGVPDREHLATTPRRHTKTQNESASRAHTKIPNPREPSMRRSKLATHRAGLYSLLIVMVLATVACNQSGTEGGQEPAADSAPAGQAAGAAEEGAPAETVVEFSHSYFSPSELTVAAGDGVVFRNVVSMSHPLTNEKLGLDTGEFTKGDRTIKFDKPGSFTITNTAHGTTMTIVVKRDGS